MRGDAPSVEPLAQRVGGSGDDLEEVCLGGGREGVEAGSLVGLVDDVDSVEDGQVQVGVEVGRGAVLPYMMHHLHSYWVVVARRFERDRAESDSSRAAVASSMSNHQTLRYCL